MLHSTFMNLKILYALENNDSIVTTYLSRSKSPREIKVMTVPISGSASETIDIRIGAVPLDVVLQEIYKSSPELIDHKAEIEGFDYNIYYKDVCELGEPLVSLGFLSKIRQAQGINSQINNKSNVAGNDEMEEDEEAIVIGSVCSNFASLLKKSYSNISSKKNGTASKDNSTTATETLEIKLQFSKIYNQVPSTSTNKDTKTYRKPAVKGVRPTAKRPTNPKPAPKAVRTQSLPIWNPMQAPGQTLPTNSIAHKIYMADRQNDIKNLSNTNNTTTQKGHSATTTRVKINDSVSKRFDFILKKKKPVNKFVKKPNSNTATKAHRMNTTPVIIESHFGTTSFKDKESETTNVTTRKNSIDVLEIPKYINNNKSHNSSAKFKQDESTYSLDADKENIDPSIDHLIHSQSEIDINSHHTAFHLLNTPDFNLKKDLGWLDEYDLFSSPALNNGTANIKTVSTTPNDANTCNTMPLEELEDDQINNDSYNIDAVEMQTALTNEIGKTSPMMNLTNHEPNSTTSHTMIDNANEHHDIATNSIIFDSTSVINSPETEKITRRNDKGNQRSMSIRDSEFEFNDKRDIKKQRVIPSSPITMFQYEDQHQDTDFNNSDPITSDDKNDLFSSFININSKKHQSSTGSTPISSYIATSSDNIEEYQK